VNVPVCPVILQLSASRNYERPWISFRGMSFSDDDAVTRMRNRHDCFIDDPLELVVSDQW